MHIGLLLSATWTIFTCPIDATRILRNYGSSRDQSLPQLYDIGTIHLHSEIEHLNLIQRSAGGCADPFPVTCPDGKTPHLQ